MLRIFARTRAHLSSATRNSNNTIRAGNSPIRAASNLPITERRVIHRRHSKEDGRLHRLKATAIHRRDNIRLTAMRHQWGEARAFRRQRCLLA